MTHAQTGLLETAPSGRRVRADDLKASALGAILRRARESRQIRIGDAAAALNIELSQLDAMENDRFDELPRPPYDLGFVRCYAQYVGLNGDTIAARYKSARPAQPQPIVLETALMRRYRPLPPVATHIAIPGLIAAIVFGVWLVLAATPGPDGSAGSVAPPPYSENAAAGLAPLPPASPVPTPADGQPPAASVVPPPPAPAGRIVQTAHAATAPAAASAAHGPDPTAAPGASDPGPNGLGPNSFGSDGVGPSGFDAAALARPDPRPTPVLPTVDSDLAARLAALPGGSDYGSGNRAVRIVLVARRAGLLRIGDAGGGVLFAQTVDADDRYYVADRDGLSLSGDVEAFEIFIDGDRLPPVPTIMAGGRLPLDPERLRRRAALP